MTLTEQQRAHAVERCRSAVARARGALEGDQYRSAIDAMRTAEAELTIAAGSPDIPALSRLVDTAWDEVTRAVCRLAEGS